jgi:hypothetical protein
MSAKEVRNGGKVTVGETHTPTLTVTKNGDSIDVIRFFIDRPKQ